MKREATADSIGLHERASATPTATHEHEHEHHAHQGLLGTAPAWTEAKLGLRGQQEWFAAIVSTPQATPAPVDERSARRLIKPSATLSSAERLDIYRRGYHARLIECLVDDYPVLQHALGEDAFEALCRAYIAAHPSSGPSLNYFGRHMSTFCRSEPLPVPGFAADLATLEWAIVLCIHAPTASAIDFADLSRVPPESWPGARFTLNPSLQILHLEYPANSYLQGYRQRQSPMVPGPRSTVVAVYRTGRSVWRLELEPTLVTLVDALRAGATLESALGEVQQSLASDPSGKAEGKTEVETAKLVSYCFQHSVSSGLFSGFTV